MPKQTFALGTGGQIGQRPQTYGPKQLTTALRQPAPLPPQTAGLTPLQKNMGLGGSQLPGQTSVPGHSALSGGPMGIMLPTGWVPRGTSGGPKPTFGGGWRDNPIARAGMDDFGRTEGPMGPPMGSPGLRPGGQGGTDFYRRDAGEGVGRPMMDRMRVLEGMRASMGSSLGGPAPRWRDTQTNLSAEQMAMSPKDLAATLSPEQQAQRQAYMQQRAQNHRQMMAQRAMQQAMSRYY